MRNVPSSIYRQYSPNPIIAAAIKTRLSQLLQSNRPAFLLAIMVKRRSADFPGHHISTVEDQVMQELILRYKDKKLDKLWHLYNVGYFQHDTEKFLEEHKGEIYEDIYSVVFRDYIQFQHQYDSTGLWSA